jgi:cytidine deaminase
MASGIRDVRQLGVTESRLRELAGQAWAVRENASVIGHTKVGCALLTTNGNCFAGCNVEYQFRCHDVHAEINAITTMLASGERRFTLIVIVAERDRFTPCGGCMDWIMQFGGGECTIVFQGAGDGDFQVHTARELMPFYPQ